MENKLLPLKEVKAISERYGLPSNLAYSSPHLLPAVQEVRTTSFPQKMGGKLYLTRQATRPMKAHQFEAVLAAADLGTHEHPMTIWDVIEMDLGIEPLNKLSPQEQEYMLKKAWNTFGELHLLDIHTAFSCYMQGMFPDESSKHRPKKLNWAFIARVLAEFKKALPSMLSSFKSLLPAPKEPTYLLPAAKGDAFYRYMLRESYYHYTKTKREVGGVYAELFWDTLAPLFELELSEEEQAGILQSAQSMVMMDMDNGTFSKLVKSIGKSTLETRVARTVKFLLAERAFDMLRARKISWQQMEMKLHIDSSMIENIQQHFIPSLQHTLSKAIMDETTNEEGELLVPVMDQVYRIFPHDSKERIHHTLYILQIAQ